MNSVPIDMVTTQCSYFKDAHTVAMVAIILAGQIEYFIKIVRSTLHFVNVQTLLTGVSQIMTLDSNCINVFIFFGNVIHI